MRSAHASRGRRHRCREEPHLKRLAAYKIAEPSSAQCPRGRGRRMANRRHPSSGTRCALSNIQRLPDQFPVDGSLGTAARRGGARRVRARLLRGHPLRCQAAGDGGHFAPEVPDSVNGVDVKLVKVWYQNGNGWYSISEMSASSSCRNCSSTTRTSSGRYQGTGQLPPR